MNCPVVNHPRWSNRLCDESFLLEYEVYLYTYKITSDEQISGSTNGKKIPIVSSFNDEQSRKETKIQIVRGEYRCDIL